MTSLAPEPRTLPLVDAADASDGALLRGLRARARGTSADVPEPARRRRAAHHDWSLRPPAQDYQMLDTQLRPAGSALRRVPTQKSRPAVIGTPARGLRAGFDSELAGFTRGHRRRRLARRAAPRGVELQLRAGPGWYLRPARGLGISTAYSLRDGRRRARTGRRAAASPILEHRRRPHVRARRRQPRVGGSITLQPRLYYLYVPYRDQSSIPVFDTALPDTQYHCAVPPQPLHRRRSPERRQRVHASASRRRPSPAAAASALLSATLGQSFYLEEPSVTLPGELRRMRAIVPA